MGKHANSTDSRLLSRIRGMKPGTVFMPRQFYDLGTRNAVASALKRMKAAGHVRQLSRGMYDRPIINEILGKVPPSSAAIAKAIERTEQAKVQPSGASAANILGISEQVPGRTTFLTSGPSRVIRIGKRQITFKHASPRFMAGAGTKAGLIVSAMRHMGRANIDAATIDAIRRNIAPDERPTVARHIAHAPAWIADAMRPILEEAGSR
jgi:hypothetical protein